MVVLWDFTNKTDDFDGICIYHVGKSNAIFTTPFLMVYTTHKNGDDWGMVYGIGLTTLNEMYMMNNGRFYGFDRC